MFKSLLVAWKDVRLFLLDKGDLAFSLLLPVITFVLMYGAFGGQNRFHGTAYIVNEDNNGYYSIMLIDRLKANESLNVVELSTGEANRKLQKSDILMVLFIPDDFSEKLSDGETASLTFKQRGNGGQEGQIVASYIRAAVSSISQELQIQHGLQKTFSGQIPLERITTVVQKYIERNRNHPVVEIEENVLGSQPDPVNQFLPGIVTMYILFAITINARTIVEERKKGTLERLLTTRLTPGQLFSGKFLAGISRGFIQTIILFLLAWAAFHIFTPVSFLEITLICLVFAAAASSLGILIATVVRSEDAATWTAVFITMAMTMLGGTFFTISPGSLMETLSKISLNTYANIAIKSVLIDGKTVSDVWKEIVVLVGASVILLVIGRALFRVLPGGKR